MITLEDVPVAILTEGLENRLWPVARLLPKPLLPIAGKPFLEHQIELLKTQGVHTIVICAGVMGEQIERRFGSGEAWGVDLYYSYNGLQQLGTAGALKKALPLLGKQFFVLNGDSYLPTDFEPILSAFLAAKSPALMAVHHNRDRWVSSNVEFSNGGIRKYCQSGGGSVEHVDYGLSLLTPEALRDVPPNVNYHLGLVFQNLIHANSLAGFEVAERFYEIASPQGFAELEAILRTMLGNQTAA